MNNARRGLPDKTKVDFSERTITVHVEERRSMVNLAVHEEGSLWRPA